MILILVIFLSIVLICVKLYLKLTTGWCTSNVCLVGKTVIITGANTGIGYETAADMAKRGATVILACRNEEKAKHAVEKLISETNNENISYKILDLASLDSIKRFAEEINQSVNKLDILINSGGIAGGFSETEATADGFELIIQTNYFGHFLLTYLLLDLLKKSAPSRIVNVSSITASWQQFLGVNNLNSTKYNRFQKYMCSKLCNVLFTVELDRRLRSDGVTSYALHPGVIGTNIFDNLIDPIKRGINFWCQICGKSLIEGAQTTIHCAVSKDIEKYSGGVFEDCHPIKLYQTAQDPDLSKQLWEKTEELLKLKKEN